MSNLLTAKEVADFLGLSYQGADYLLRVHAVPIAERVGTTRRFRQRDIERLREVARPVGRPGRKRKSQPAEAGA